MNTDRLEGSWEMLKGKVQEKWGKLTNDDLAVIQGKRKQLAGKLQERYGYLSEKAENEIDRFLATCENNKDKKSDACCN